MIKYTVMSVLVGMFLLFCSGLAQADLSDGLVAYYPFNGNANDESGNGNHGVINGPTQTIDRHGNNNSAYFFDGRDDYITIAHNKMLNVDNQFSICAWMQVNSNSNGYSSIISKGGDDSSGEPHVYFLRIRPSSSVSSPIVDTEKRFQVFFLGQGGVSDDNEFSLISNEQWYENEWSFVVGLFNGTTFKIYINGSLDSEGNFHYPDRNPAGHRVYSNSYDLEIGRRFGDEQSKHHFNGSLDEIRIYNRALSQSEILQIYEGKVCEDRYDEGYDDGYETGKQYCIDYPEACGISVSGGCSQADLNAEYQNGYNAGCSACSNGSPTPATLSPGLDMHIPVLQYDTLLGTMNLWADFEFEGESNGDLIWKLSDFGQE
ncbi:putative LamG-like jellyroll fold [Desulfamplus magnetovallimortis]|uniref:Putative LamG-like jellyroll fold n=1 Tax=Desulfamplus magnetovallimortis TaxID=1246637 RepID=A0A1W1H8U8_9BACT|nr:LamG domain-containing protein [Desulfamplus magnetovallimortis]SLM28798.1 putative LamG-like jellyroll fold [Desulfamplus magnetovallimortis]